MAPKTHEPAWLLNGYVAAALFLWQVHLDHAEAVMRFWGGPDAR